MLKVTQENSCRHYSVISRGYATMNAPAQAHAQSYTTNTPILLSCLLYAPFAPLASFYNPAGAGVAAGHARVPAWGLGLDLSSRP